MTDHAAIETALKQRLSALTGEVDAIGAELSTPLDADFSEQANELEGQDALKSVEAVQLGEIDAIHAALARIEAGTYGQCRVCGKDIAPARLAALPTASTCIACAA